MKFKTLIATLTALILMICMSFGNASASVALSDNDVGWHCQFDSPEMAQNFQENTFEFPAVVPQNKANNSTHNNFPSKHNENVQLGADDKVSPNKTWVGADTKARLESTASVSNYSHLVTPSSSLKFGKGTKRLIY